MSLVQPVQIVGGDDGGLALRMQLRGVMERMRTARYKGARTLTKCGECIADESMNVRKYATWDGLRTHLITFHGFDSRVVPR